MAVITLIVVLVWWNPQKLLTYYYDDCQKKIEQIKNEEAENVD